MDQKKLLDENPGTNCELSMELLYLLKWLLEHESGTLKTLIMKALHNGLNEKIMHNKGTNNAAVSQELQNSIIDFLDVLDSMLIESINEDDVKKTLQRNMIPAIDKIDLTTYDKSALQASLDRVTARLEHNPQENANEMLYKEILRRWKPTKKKVHH